jgi:hypothetical protein
MLIEFASYVTYNLIKLEHASEFGYAFICFIYDTFRIFMLLSVINFVIFTAGRCFEPDKMKHMITYKDEFIDKILEKLLAVVRVPFNH